LSPAGPVGAAERVILLNSLAIMLVIVVPTLIAAVAFAWWFRASNTRARHRPDWAYSGRIELIVWSIPTLVILFLAGVIWTGTRDLDPARPPGAGHKVLEVQVISLDWKWLFIYPREKLATVNYLVVPTGTPFRLSLTSASVMNVFFVPRLGSMIYTMNGMVTLLHLQADQAGQYAGQSAQFSGDGFSDMRFVVRAVSQAGFESWVAGARAGHARLDRYGYVQLSRPLTNVDTMTFGDVETGLFDAVVSQQIAPAPGPSNRTLSAPTTALFVR
jgi:cytochrome o ubiquinol oxidase subunit 2